MEIILKGALRITSPMEKGSILRAIILTGAISKIISRMAEGRSKAQILLSKVTSTMDRNPKELISGKRDRSSSSTKDSSKTDISMEKEP